MIEFTDAEVKEDLWALNDFQDREEMVGELTKNEHDFMFEEPYGIDEDGDT